MLQEYSIAFFYATGFDPVIDSYNLVCSVHTKFI
jgi:hypothetical protein